MIDLPLKDIHLPASMVENLSLPFTYYLLIGALIIALVVMILFMKKQFKPSLKRQALKNLEEIQKRFLEIKDPSVSLAEISVFLRRAAMSQKNYSQVASLSGKAWLELLDTPLKSQEFSEGIGKILLNGPYQRAADENEVRRLLELVFRWVRSL